MIRYFVRLVFCLAVLTGSTVSLHALDKSYYTPSSKLASGKWVKISVKGSGIYQITADDVRSWGLGNDLSQIHVFGYGGAPLSETMKADNYADDLPQMPVVRFNDRILFYAQGPTTWKSDSIGAGLSKQCFEQLQVQHPYSTLGCYFVTNDSRFTDIDIPKADNNPNGVLRNSYTERLYHEQEIINPGETGRKFLGESFAANHSQTFDFDLEGIVPNSVVHFYPVFAAQTTGAVSRVTYSYNNNEIPADGTDVIQTVSSLGHEHYYLASQSIKHFTLEGTDKLSLKVDYACNGTVHMARLDFLTVNFERRLALRKGILSFCLNEARSDNTYQLSGSSAATRVWDVTYPFAPVQMNVVMKDGAGTFSPQHSGRREFIAFTDTLRSYLHPDYIAEVANQDIHVQVTPDMIILAPSAYLEQAQRVADLHERYDNFRVLVLDHEKVFNEFSSGTQDAMAYRRLCKMFYDRGKSEDGHELRYLLLMGGGNYDNRSIGPNATTSLSYPRLLTWQTEDSNTEDNSITTDDYFAVLDDGSTTTTYDIMNIAVGRMIVKSADEARAVVNKLEKYITKPSYGAWKNKIMFVADDENNGDHMNQSKDMIAVARQNGGENMMYNYVFTDAFNSVSNGGSRTYPDARTKMFSSLNEGVLWWNYIGHASTQNWTGEGLLMRSDVENLLYYRHLPVLYAATCEFCRFDNSAVSSGERMFINPNGGVIALMCPARLAYIHENGILSRVVARYIFSRDSVGEQRRIGDILRLAKNHISTSSDNNRRFFVYGDPAMRLAYAPLTARIETINGDTVNKDVMPIFKAREQLEFTGKIIGLDGKVATNFNGAVISTLFGPEQSVTTKGHPNGSGAKVTYEDRPNRLAITVDTVQGGEFTVRVIIPSEVNNEYGNYRQSLINLYAYDSSNNLEAMGSNSDFYIYGYEDEEVADTIGPAIITMGLNNEYFVDASEVNESPLLLATVADESGVNFSQEGIGHSMTLTLDGTTSYNDLVNYYTPLYTDEGTLGSISYQLNDLSEGFHTLRLRVWDVYNNVSEKTITFNVVNGLAPVIADIYSLYSSGETSFYVKHNRPDAVVSVTIDVYDLMGRPVWHTTQSGRSDMFTSTPVIWNLIDDAGRRVPRGIYVYRATITTDGMQVATKAKKLAVPAN